MNKTLKKILSGIITASMLMSSAVAVYAEGETASTNPWEVEKGEGTFRFGIMSDTHIAPGGASDTMQMGLEAFGKMGVDGLALVGDISISEVPYTSEKVEENLHTSVKAALDTYKYEIKADDNSLNDSEKLPLVYAMGNHELATNHQNATGIWYAKELFAREYNLADLSTAQIVDGKYTGNYVTEMGGYKFIVASPNNGLEVDAFNSAAYKGAGIDTEGWVKEQIIAADAAYGDANKPIFYMQHIPVDGHYGKNAKANTTEFLTFLKNYPNVIVISAHTHNLIHDPRLISQDSGYTSIITGAMSGGQANVWNGNISGIGTGASSVIAQQMAIDVDYDDASKTSNIKVYRMDVENQEFIGDPYEFTLNGEAQTKYSTQLRYEDEGRSIAAWNEDAALTATAVEGTRNVTATYPTSANSATVTAGANADVLQDDFLWGYKIFAVNKATGVADKTSTQAFEFFRTPTVNERTAKFENLERNQEYEIKAYPITIFQITDTYQELDAAGVEPLTQTVEVNSVKSDIERKSQTIKNILVSAKKTASYLQHDGTTTALTDDAETTADELWVNNTPGVGFILDLERSYKITDIDIVADEANASGRTDFILYGSNDKENWSEIYIRNSSDTNDAFGTNIGTTSQPSFETDTLNCPIMNEYYRYIKIRYVGYTILEEIKVYADVPLSNVAYQKDIITDYVCNVNDSDATYWHQVQLTNGKDYGYVSATDKDFTVDLGKQYNIHHIVLKRPAAHDNDGGSKYYTLYVSKDNQEWVPVGSANGTINSKVWNGKVGTHFIDENESYRYVKYSHPYYFVLHEIEVYAVHPDVNNFEYTDGIVTLSFTDVMNFENVNKDIKVYDSEGTVKTVTFTPNADNTAVTFAADTGDRVVVSEYITNTNGMEMQENVEYDIYDLTIDYSGKTKKKFVNMNVAYGKNVITDYVPDQDDKVYYAAEKLTDGVDVKGYVSATNETFIIDLGRAYNVNKIVLRESDENKNDGSKIHYILSASADGETWVQIDKAPTAMANINTEVWNGRVGTYNIDEDVNYRYIKFYHPYYQTLTEIEVYADVEATKVTNKSNTVTSSAVGSTYQGFNKYLVDNSANLTYVNANNSVNGDSGTNTLLNWISVEMDKAYPVGMYELYVRDWKADGSHGMGSWQNNHYVKLYGSNKAPTEQLDEYTTNLSVKDLTPYGFDELADTFSADPYVSMFPNGFSSKQKMPEGWIFTNVYRETLNNTTKYKNLTLKKYNPKYYYTMEFGEFAAYVLNATVNAVDADANGVDIHFGDKMVSDLLNDDTVTLTKDGVAVDYKGTLSENGMVYTLDATLADGFYTLTVADDVKNVLGVPMQADFTYDFAIGDVYGIKTADGAAVSAIAANTTYIVTEPVSGNNARIAIAAIYDASSNVLVASAIENIPADFAEKYAEVEITTPETLPEGAYYVRYFLWDANTLMPTLNESIKVFE